jgi:hypothetical protein
VIEFAAVQKALFAWAVADVLSQLKSGYDNPLHTADPTLPTLYNLLQEVVMREAARRSKAASPPMTVPRKTKSRNGCQTCKVKRVGGKMKRRASNEATAFPRVIRLTLARS